MYFKFFELKSCGKRSANNRRRINQCFHKKGILRRLTAPRDDSFFIVFISKKKGTKKPALLSHLFTRVLLDTDRTFCNNEYRKQKGCDTDEAGRNSALQRYPFAFLRQLKQKAANHCSAIAPVHLRFYIFKKKLKRGQKNRPLVTLQKDEI